MILIDTYTKMLLALPSDCPLFKEWKWNLGDQYILREDRKHKAHFIGDSILYRGKPYDLRELTTHDIADNLFDAVPIPSQEQLQNICLANNPQKWAHDINISDLHALFFNFRTWIQEDDEDSWWDFRDDIEDFRQAWLMFTMETVYDLVWDGEKFQ